MIISSLPKTVQAIQLGYSQFYSWCSSGSGQIIKISRQDTNSLVHLRNNNNIFALYLQYISMHVIWQNLPLEFKETQWDCIIEPNLQSNEVGIDSDKYNI